MPNRSARSSRLRARGFGAVKMRVGVMDGDVATSVARVTAAATASARAVDLMVDAHGTFAPANAIAFARAVESCRIRWFEEPVSADDRAVAPRASRHQHADRGR